MRLPSWIANCLAGVILCAVVTGSALAWSPPAFDPNHLDRYGYDLVFDAEFDSPSDVDFSLAPSGRTKTALYGRLFDKWGGIANSASPARVTMAHGILTIAGGQLSTIAQSYRPPFYIGTTFQGGAYFEARLKWDRQKIAYDSSRPLNSITNWWPSFYAVAAEYFTGAMRIPGTATVHFTENDWFEAWLGNYYGATLHDWFGPLGCAPGAPDHGLDYCEIASDGTIVLPPGTTPSDAASYGQTILGDRVTLPPDPANGFHIVGALWVSAAHAPGHIGYIAFYFDDKLVGKVRHWTQAAKTAIPPSAATVFSQIDNEHAALFIGAPQYTPLQVDWIRVWQPNSNQLRNKPVAPTPDSSAGSDGGP